MASNLVAGELPLAYITNCPLQVVRMKIQLSQPGLERHFPVAAHQIKAARPRLIRTLRSRIHAIYHNSKGQRQPAKTERGMLLLLSQVARRRQVDSLLLIDGALPLR